MNYGLQCGAVGRGIKKTGARARIPEEGRVKKEDFCARKTRASRVFRGSSPRLMGCIEWGAGRDKKKGTRRRVPEEGRKKG